MRFECVCFWEKMKNHQENGNQDRNFQLFPASVLIYCSFDDTIALN